MRPRSRGGMSRGRDTSSRWPRRGLNASVHLSSPVAPLRTWPLHAPAATTTPCPAVSLQTRVWVQVRVRVTPQPALCRRVTKTIRSATWQPCLTPSHPMWFVCCLHKYSGHGVLIRLGQGQRTELWGQERNRQPLQGWRQRACQLQAPGAVAGADGACCAARVI